MREEVWLGEHPANILAQKWLHRWWGRRTFVKFVSMITLS